MCVFMSHSNLFLTFLKFCVSRGDGREYVCCTANAVKIRAEDGRAVTGVDISPFINNLPMRNRYVTKTFTSEGLALFQTLIHVRFRICVISDASGSTSQAANICEAMEVSTNLLLIDEDTCATVL